MRVLPLEVNMSATQSVVTKKAVSINSFATFSLTGVTVTPSRTESLNMSLTKTQIIVIYLDRYVCAIFLLYSL